MLCGGGILNPVNIGDRMKVLILDIGNSKTKCYVFGVDPNRKYYQNIDILHEQVRLTPRKHPYDLRDTCRSMLTNAICEFSPDVGMVTAYGDAFVLKSKRQFAQADEPAPPLENTPDYHINGWPNNIQLTGVHLLKHKHASKWADMHSINGFVVSELCGKQGDDPWHAWDLTQASISACFNIQTQKWIIEDANKSSKEKKWTPQYQGAPNIIPSSKKIGYFQGMPILAGGLDNAFVDTDNTDPYIIAGTWLVMGAVAKTTKAGLPLRAEFTNARKQGGVRWLISGNGNYVKQIVKKVSNPITDEEMDQALKDLKLLGVEPGKERSYFKPARVRVLGGYGQELAENLVERTNSYDFYTPSSMPMRSDLYQHECSAMFVYNTIIR